jgi:hypothetical protein
MSRDDDDDDVASSPEASEQGGFVPLSQALELSTFTLIQLRSLVGAGIVRTERAKRGGSLLYCVEDLERLASMPRSAEPPDQSPMAVELAAITAGYRGLLDVALKQTKQAQEHERLIVTAFTKPLEAIGEHEKTLVTAVLEQNKQLVARANAGDMARLDFVKGAESMLRDQRNELREQAELDRKHELKREMWEGVKKAAPKLLEGFRATTGADRLEAALALKAKLDPAKVAALIHYKLLGEEEIGLLCTALDLDRAAIEALNADADSMPTEPPPPDVEPEAEAAQ